MMKLIFLFTILCFSMTAWSSAYLGGSYGYSAFSSEQTKEYKLNQKGPSYGGFFGIGKEFVGLEAFYQNFETTGKIKHDGGKYDYTTNANVMGGALRFSFNTFYARLGFGRYTLKQEVKIDDESERSAAEEIYNIQDGEKKNGVLFGLGAHRRFGNSVLTFIDYSRHQISGIGNYDVISVGVAFNISDRIFGLGKL